MHLRKTRIKEDFLLACLTTGKVLINNSATKPF